MTWKDDSINFRELRAQEKEIKELIIEGKDKHSYVAIYNLGPHVKEQALLGIITTTVVMILLGLSTMVQSSNINTLIIAPIEHMISLINDITSDPLKAAHDEEQRVLMKEMNDKEEFGEDGYNEIKA
jgi:hypothetical protein